MATDLENLLTSQTYYSRPVFLPMCMSNKA
jgi:hypothetical protein